MDSHIQQKSDVKPRHHVLVHRQWHNPNINIKMCNKEIGIDLELTDFVRALAKEVGNPIGMFTQSQLEKKLLDASSRVVHGMKKETERVV